MTMLSSYDTCQGGVPNNAREYFTKFKESIVDEHTLLILNQSSSRRDIKFMYEKLGEIVQPMLFPRDTKQYLQSFDVQTFHKYKHVITRLLEYSSNHQKLCGDEYLTSRKILFKLHHVFYNQLPESVFKAMGQKGANTDKHPILKVSIVDIFQHTGEGTQPVRPKAISKLFLM